MTALLLSPHNDDETLFATFTILRERPHVIICLRSFSQEQFGITFVEREEETDMAMALLGVSWTQLPIPDTRPDWDQVRHVVEEWQPHIDVLYAPADELGGNEQHNMIAAIADRLKRDGYCDRVIHYMTYNGSPGRKSTSEWEVPIQFSSWLPLKREALACYQSQIDLFERNGSQHFKEDLKEYYA